MQRELVKPHVELREPLLDEVLGTHVLGALVHDLVGGVVNLQQVVGVVGDLDP